MTKEEIKLLLFRDDMKLYIENTNCTKIIINK